MKARKVRDIWAKPTVSSEEGWGRFRGLVRSMAYWWLVGNRNPGGKALHPGWSSTYGEVYLKLSSKSLILLGSVLAQKPLAPFCHICAPFSQRDRSHSRRVMLQQTASKCLLMWNEELAQDLVNQHFRSRDQCDCFCSALLGRRPIFIFQGDHQLHHRGKWAFSILTVSFHAEGAQLV